MRAKDLENLPIRTFDNEFNVKLSSKFAIDRLLEDKVGEGVAVEAHRHDYYHIIYIKRGNGEHVVDFKNYEIKPNSIFFVSPGQVHSLVIDKSVEGFAISFNSSFYHLNDSLQKLLDYPFFHSLSNSPVIYLSEDDENMHQIMNDMLVEFQMMEKRSDNMLRALMEVFLIRASRLYEQIEVKHAPSHLTYQLRKLESLVDTHFKECKMLNDYAEMMYISPKHLNSLCKKGLNKTVTNLIHERTLTEAKRMLLFTNNTISEIAFELGFADKSYFMRFFKKNTSLTADSYRKQNQKSRSSDY